MTYIDLTQALSEDIFQSPMMPPLQITRSHDHDQDGLNISHLSMSTHSGTHLDAPLHHVVGAEDIASISLDRLIRPAFCLHVAHQGGEEITAEELEAEAEGLEVGDMLFLHSGWDAYYRTDHAQYDVHPYLSTSAADWIVDRGVGLLGLDVLTPDAPQGRRPPGFDWPVHHALLGAGVLIVENLAHLDLVCGSRFEAWVIPMPIAGADGAPARVLARIAS